MISIFLSEAQSDIACLEFIAQSPCVMYGNCLPAWQIAQCLHVARSCHSSPNVVHTPPEVVDERLWAVHNRLARHVGHVNCMFPGHGGNAAITASELYEAAACPGRPLVCGWLRQCFAYL